MKLWKRWTAAVLAAAMALLLLAACGPSGPSTPDAPDKPGSSEPGKDPTDPGTGEPGKDPTDEKTEAQKKAAVVDALNAVRKDYGNDTPLKLNEQACAIAKEMAQVQLDGVNGKYGENLSTNTDYIAACANAADEKSAAFLCSSCIDKYMRGGVHCFYGRPHGLPGYLLFTGGQNL